MKKSVKFWLVIAATLILVGLLCFAGVMTMLHWNFSALDSSDWRTETVEIDRQVLAVDILSDTEDIVLLPSPDGRCRVEFRDRDTVKHSAEVDAEGTLLIRREEREGSRLSLFGSGAPKITLYLPVREYVSLYIQEDTGDVDIPGDFRFGQIIVQAGTGDVRCAASSATELRVETSTGDIRLEKLSAESIGLAVSTGDVTLRGVNCQSLVTTGSTGDVVLEDVIAEETISVERSTGDVELERCDAPALTIGTTTGDVTGTLLTNKRFVTKTDTGDVKVPDADAARGTCTVTTSTGDILIGLASR